MSLSMEQQTSHLSRLQQEVLAWDFYRMGSSDDLGASGGRKLREVPMTFGSINEYLDVFEPLVLEECAAQVCRGEDEIGKRPANIGAVFRSERVNGFHVVQFILGEEAMTEFHDNDLILLSKTDPTVVEDDLEATDEPAKKKTITGADAAAAAAAVAAATAIDGNCAEASTAGGDGETPGDATADGEKDGKSGDGVEATGAAAKKKKREEEEMAHIDEDPEAMANVYALGYVDGREGRNRMRVRFYLPETVKVAGGVVGNAATNAASASKSDAKADAEARRKGMQQQEEDYGRFRAVRNALSSPGSAWYLMHLANMSTIAREWLALHAFPSLPFAHTILSGKPVANLAHASWELPAPLSVAMKNAYNDSQMTALSAALEKQPITLIQGPPGTGKTRIILSLLSVILHAVPGVKSGQEVDLKRFLDVRDGRKTGITSGEIAEMHRKSMPWLSGLGNPRDAPPLPRNAPRPTPPPIEKPEILGEESYRRTKVLICAPSNSALDEIVSRIMKSGVYGPNGSAYSPTLVRVGVNVHHSVEAVGMESLVTGRMSDKGEGLMNKEKKFERALERDRIKLAILDEAAVVCSTLAFSGSGMFARMTRQFDVVVIDEAAQAVEPSTLVPLCYGAKQVFLVGDPRQLPATVLSSIATDHKYNQSLFKRFEHCGYPIHMLKTQYRMHPAIREFPSSQFYAGALEDGPRQAAKTRAPWHKIPLFRPFVFLDISGKEYQGNGTSWANDEEATMVVALVCMLMKTYPELSSGENIGVISPYKAQVKNLKKKLADALGTDQAKAVDVGSIDGFQGREKDVCIFSVVRAPAHGRGLGFVADERRINVGLTRAKNSLIVLGCARALTTDKNWGGLVASATARNLVMKPPNKDYVGFVAKFGSAYDKDELSGSEDEAADDDDEEAYGDGHGHGDVDGGVNGAAFVHRPDWTKAAGADGEEDAPAPEGISIAAAGFSVGSADVELVTEAPVKGGGNDDGGTGGGGDDAPDPYAQEPEAGGGAKRGRGGGGGGGGGKAARTK